MENPNKPIRAWSTTALSFEINQSTTAELCRNFRAESAVNAAWAYKRDAAAARYPWSILSLTPGM
jgi:hypothetical protein